MAAPTEDTMDKENMPEMVEIEATVATGFEQTARDEAEEKLGTQARTGRGKITMKIPLNDAFKVLNLGCIDNIRVVMTTKQNFEFSKNELESMRRLREIVRDVEWANGLKVWEKVYTFSHPIAGTPDVIPEDLGEPFIVTRERQQKKQKPKKMNKDKFQNRQKEKEQNRRKGKDGDTWKEDKKAKSDDVTESQGGDTTEILKDSSESEKVVDEAGDSMSGQFDDVEEDHKSESVDKNADSTAAEKTSTADDIKPEGQKEISSSREENKDVLRDEGSSVDKHAEDESCAVTEEQKTVSGESDMKADTNLSEKTEAESEPAAPTVGMDNADVSKTTEDEAAEEKKKKLDPTKPTFRVTCNRTGEFHSFDSMCAAANFGDAVQTYFGWNVDMKNFDIEVMLNIEDRDVSVCIGLTKQSLHRRNLVSFGPTTLRPTIAYNMLRLCRIHPGDVVCDPMCGSGSIPIQSAISWPKGFHLCGDNFPKACDRTMENITSLNSSYKEKNKKEISLEVAKWDVCNLPLRDGSVDIFITDLPFGKRMGSKFNNMVLYPAALTEMARVCRPGWGRACFLTVDKKCMIKTMQMMTIRRYWQRRMILGINLGGLAAGVFLLTRTEFPFISETPFPNISDKEKKKTSEKPASGGSSGESPMNSKQMSAERLAAIQMARDLTSRPLKDRSENTEVDSNKTQEVTLEQDIRKEMRKIADPSENTEVNSNKSQEITPAQDIRKEVNKTADTSEKAANPSENTVNPSEKNVDCSDKTADPSENMVDPSEDTSNPFEKIEDLSEKITDPSESTVESSENMVDP